MFSPIQSASLRLPDAPWRSLALPDAGDLKQAHEFACRESLGVLMNIVFAFMINISLLCTQRILQYSSDSLVFSSIEQAH